MAANCRRAPPSKHTRQTARKLAGLIVAAALLAAYAAAAAQTAAKGQPADENLKQSVMGRVFDAHAGFFADVQLDIIDGDALLTGRVATVQDKARATALVRSVPGVQTVINAIHVGALDNLKQISSDLLLQRRIRKEMRAAFGNRMPRASWRATDGVVYVFGHAATEWEHNRALAVIKQVSGVGRVVDYLRLTD
jgi:osmotically-inducible protein OsmY